MTGQGSGRFGRRIVLPNAVALAAGVTVGMIVDSAGGAGLAALVFACLLTLRDGRPGRR
jgi:hypothetical protein